MELGGGRVTINTQTLVSGLSGSGTVTFELIIDLLDLSSGSSSLVLRESLQFFNYTSGDVIEFSQFDLEVGETYVITVMAQNQFGTSTVSTTVIITGM